MSNLRPLLVFLVLVLCSTACAGPRSVAPDTLTGDGSMFTREVGQELDDRELDNVLADLEKEARMELVAYAAEQVLRDLNALSTSDFRPGTDAYERIVSRADDYIRRTTSRSAGPSEDGRLAVLELEVDIDRDLLIARLAELYVIQGESRRTILVLRDFSSEVDSELGDLGIETDDLAEKLSFELVKQGFEPQLWNDLSLNIANDLTRGDVAQEALLMDFVVASDWRDASDERYALPMIVLRQHGRMMVGLTILEFRKVSNSLAATVRMDVYDLFNGRSLGTKTFGDSERLASMTVRQTGVALLDRISDEAVRWAAGRIQETTVLEARGRNEAYTLVLEGFDAQQRNDLETLLVRTIAEDAQSASSGGILTVDFTMSRSPVVVRGELERILDFMGFAFEPVERDGNTFRITAR